MQADVDPNSPAGQSRLMWMLRALGPEFVLLLPATALIALVVVLILVLRGKGPAMVGAILLVVPLPIYVALLGVLSGMIRTCGVVLMADTPIKQSDLADVLADVLICMLFAMTLTLPAILLATAGLIVRALQGESPTAGPGKAKPIA